jgi:hypothetical protein
MASTRLLGICRAGLLLLLQAFPLLWVLVQMQLVLVVMVVVLVVVLLLLVLLVVVVLPS